MPEGSGVSSLLDSPPSRGEAVAAEGVFSGADEEAWAHFPRLTEADADDLDAAACRRLWAAILTENLAAAGGRKAVQNSGQLDEMRARQWIGSDDFREVAALAGFEPEALLDKLAGPEGASILHRISGGKNHDSWRPSPAQAREAPAALRRAVQAAEREAREAVSAGKPAKAPPPRPATETTPAPAPARSAPRPAPETTPAPGLSEVWPFRAHRAVAELAEAPEPPAFSATPPAGLKALSPVSDRNLKPRAPGPRPALRWIPLSRLAVSEAYQRAMAARSVTMIRKAVEAFDWARLKPLSVAARADGWYEVLDGQHTATILLMVGADEAPCLVLPDAAEAEKAEAFVGLNSSRVQVTPMQRHHAAVAAGRAEALAVEAACRAAGARLLRNAKPAGRYLPGETVAAPALTAIAGRQGMIGLTRVLQPCVLARLAPIPTDAVLAVELLLFDPAWAGELVPSAIAIALGDLKARLAEAETLRARAPQPRPRALAAAIFRAAGASARATAGSAFEESARGGASGR